MQKIEENNRMGKARDLFEKIRDTKGIFHAKMGKIKDRNGMDLTEDKKKWQEYADELYEKENICLHHFVVYLKHYKSTISNQVGFEVAQLDLTEDIKKRWQEYTEELDKKIFMTQIITVV